LPAFVAILTNLGFVTLLVGPATVPEWLDTLDSFEETIVLVIVLVAITMVAFLLRALTFITFAFFVGSALPRPIAEWSARGQRRNRVRALAKDARGTGPAGPSLHEQVRRVVEQRYPHDEHALQPTRLGNILEVAVEHPWIVYGMDGMLWLPHLLPSLPSYLGDALDGAQARLLGLLNLSLVCAVLAGEAVLVLGVVGQQWLTAVGAAIVGGAVAWVSYQAGVNQAMEVSGQIRVAFNLYRQEILKQLGRDVPATAVAERALWQALTQELLGQPVDAVPRGGTGTTAANTTS
jgi:hypothetical protein